MSMKRPEGHGRRRLNEVITTFDALRECITPWAKGKGGMDAMVILSRPGTMKTTTARELAEAYGGCLYVNGSNSPKAVYCECYLHRDAPILFDDIRVSIPLCDVIQPLCDNYKTKRMRWAIGKAVQAYADGDEDGELLTLPRKFETASCSLFLTNEIGRLERLPGLLDRCYVVKFDPPTAEILTEVQRRGFVDEEVLAWAWHWAPFISELHVRDLDHATKNKALGKNWKVIIEMMYFGSARELPLYEDSLGLPEGVDRPKWWAEHTGRCVGWYYEVQKQYRKVHPAPNRMRGRHVARKKARAEGRELEYHWTKKGKQKKAKAKGGKTTKGKRKEVVKPTQKKAKRTKRNRRK